MSADLPIPDLPMPDLPTPDLPTSNLPSPAPAEQSADELANQQRDAWNEASPIYRKRHQQNWSVDRVHYGSLVPNEDELHLIGAVKGKRALVLGCGSGENAIALARQGAAVTGVDVSDVQLAQARQQAAETGVDIHFVQSAAHRLDFLPDASQDLALAVFMLLYVAPIKETLAGLYRCLHPGGRLIISQDHPLRASFWDAELEDESILPVRGYFESAPLHWPYSESGTPMVSYHRTVGEWVDLLHGAGFSLQKLLEFPLPEEMLDQPWTDEYTEEIGRQLPQSIIFVAQK